MTTALADVQAQISQLFVYPIKSCAGVAVSEAILTPTGLDLDRAWMVVDARGDFVSQRELPRMALIQPTLRHYDLVLRAPGMLALHLAIDAAEQPVTVRVWDDEVRAYDMGVVAAQWFTDFLSPAGSGLGPLRLVRFDPDEQRLADKRWTGGVSAPNQFSDGFPVLVAGEASLALFNRQLAEAGQAAVGMARFRPNLVLSGLDAYDEDHIDKLWLGDGEGDAVVQLRLVKPCVRCSIPDVDPASAELGHAVGDLLLAQRPDTRMGGALTWGMNAIVLAGDGQTLRCGQTLHATYRFD